MSEIEQVINSTDPQFLSEVLKRGNNDEVSRRAALNPHCPPEALSEVLKRGNNDGVSRCAAENPNCPEKDKNNFNLILFLKENNLTKERILELFKDDEKTSTIEKPKNISVLYGLEV